MVELNPARWLNRLVDLEVNSGFDADFKGHLKDGEPILVFNHQSQADGVAAAIVADYLLNLSRTVEGDRQQLKGFVMPVAKSLVDGQQGWRLYISFHPFNFLMAKRGLKTLPYTREKDANLYGLNRSDNKKELLTIKKKLDKGYRFAVFPEGSVEGGRRLNGDAVERIKGIQEVQGKELIQAYRLTKATQRRRHPFFVAVGLDGGYKVLNPNIGELGPTKAGLATFFGMPENLFPHVKIVARLGAIITEDVISEKFGQDWPKADPEIVKGVNRLIMGFVAGLVPDLSRGSMFQALELERAS